jgi:hypothetical protein
MDIKQQLAEARALNEALKAQLARKPKPKAAKAQPVSNCTSALYLQTVQSPGFAAFCRRRAPTTMWGERVAPPLPTFAEACRARASSIRSFMKRKGISTVTGEYETGRVIRFGGADHYDCEDRNCPDCYPGYGHPEKLRMRRKGNDVISVDPDPNYTVMVGEWQEPKWWWNKFQWQELEVARVENERLKQRVAEIEAAKGETDMGKKKKEVRAGSAQDIKSIAQVMALVDLLEPTGQIVVTVANGAEEQEYLRPVCWDWQDQGDTARVTIEKSWFDEVTRKGAA